MKENDFICWDVKKSELYESKRSSGFRKSVHLFCNRQSYENCRDLYYGKMSTNCHIPNYKSRKRKCQERRSLNINLKEQSVCLNKEYKMVQSGRGMRRNSKRMLSSVMYDGGMCREVNTPTSFLDSSFEKDNFDIITFMLKSDVVTWSLGELPLTRESILEGMKYEDEEKENILKRTPLSDDDVEFLLFGKTHNFKNYQEPNFRDLMQLTYASLYGVEKDLLKLKLLQTPEKLINIPPKLEYPQDVSTLVEDLKDKILDLYFFFSKENLEKQEIEIFNKIIYWLTGFSKDLPHRKVLEILNRVKIELLFYNPMYLILIEFIEELLGTNKLFKDY